MVDMWYRVPHNTYIATRRVQMINAMLTVATVTLAYVWEAVLGFPLPKGTTPPQPTGTYPYPR